MSLPILFLLTRDEQLAATLRTQLSELFEFQICETLVDAHRLLRQCRPWSIVADFRQTSQGGHAEDRFLEEVQECLPQAEVAVLISEFCPEPVERRLACNRAARFVEPVDGTAIATYLSEKAARLASSALEQHLAPENVPAARVSASVHVKPAEVQEQDDYVVSGLTRKFETNTPKLKMMLADLEVAAKHDVTILLIGETGAGKTFLSKLVHEISPRRNEPFLPVACGALPSELIESELFGHVKGAFTSAHADKDGKFVAARRGTILLDEIDVLGPEQQVKLLRVIESGEFEPVGSNRTMRSEARLIVASNLELQPLVEQGKFRPDLYYRLNMLKFDIPPLRERKPDIVPLAKKFIKEQSLKHNIRIDHIDEGLFVALQQYPWPGNVRELEHVIQRAVIYSRDATLSTQHLPSHVVMGMVGPGNESHLTGERFQPQDAARRNSLGRQVAFSEREIIEQALFQHNYSRTSTAKALGISRVTLYNKMKKYGMTK